MAWYDPHDVECMLGRTIDLQWTCVGQEIGKCRRVYSVGAWRHIIACRLVWLEYAEGIAGTAITGRVLHEDYIEGTRRSCATLWHVMAVTTNVETALDSTLPANANIPPSLSRLSSFPTPGLTLRTTLRWGFSGTPDPDQHPTSATLGSPRAGISCAFPGTAVQHGSSRARRFR